MAINNLVPTSIRLTQCSKRYADGTVAVEPLDLEIGAGETVVILGPSGCGKTTTLRMIAGLEAPDPGGTIHFGDDDVRSEEHTSELQSLMRNSYAVFCLNKKKNVTARRTTSQP